MAKAWAATAAITPIPPRTDKTMAISLLLSLFFGAEPDEEDDAEDAEEAEEAEEGNPPTPPLTLLLRLPVDDIL